MRLLAVRGWNRTKPREGLPWAFVSIGAASILAVAIVSGCSMCQSPWDYCNAVVGPGGCPYCDFGARAGSIYAPMGPIPPTTEVGPTAAPESKPAAKPEAAEPAAESAPGEDDEPPPGL